MSRLFVLAALTMSVVDGSAAERVRSEGGRFSIECRSASLEEILRELAVVAGIELWLDENSRGLANERVTVDVRDVTLRQAVEELFEEASVNFVLTFEPENPERVTKIYAGGGGTGRLARTPTFVPEETEATELDAASLLDTPEAQDALEELGAILGSPELQEAQIPTPEGELPEELRQLLQGLPFPEPPAEEKPKQD